MRALILAIVMAVASPAVARYPRSPVDTHELAQDSCVSQTIDISGATATDVVAASTALVGATGIEVYNPDTDKIHCGFTSSVSKTSSSADFGREVLGKVGIWLSVNLDKISTYYCIGSQAYTTRATITKCR